MLYREATTGGTMPPDTATQLVIDLQDATTQPVNGISSSLPSGSGVIGPSAIAGPPFGWSRIEQTGYGIGETLEEAISNLPADLRALASEVLL